MISKRDNTTNFIDKLEEKSNALGGGHSPDWLSAMRKEALARFVKLGIPTVKDEDWKYTSLVPLAANTYALAQNSELIEAEAFQIYADKAEINIVFVNGVFDPDHSTLDLIPQGVTILTLKDAVADQASGLEKLLTKYSASDQTAFIALNEALNDHGTYITVDENVVHRGLIHIIHVTSSSNKNTVATPRTVIALAKSSEITVLESHIAFNDKITYFSDALTDCFIGENATLHYCNAQKESLKAFHIGNTRVWLERDANFDGFTLTAGGQLTRNNLDIVLNGEGCDAILNSLYSVYSDQHVDNHTSVDHRVPNCTSNQLYKGILNGKARAVFNGKVFVRSIAQQTNSYQLNKNLLLGEDCRVDTKPQLEIFADDVKCTHGATIGQLDEDEMFYLQTRAIPRNTATKMLVHGFVDDLFETIKHESIRQKINTLIQPSYEVLA